MSKQFNAKRLLSFCLISLLIVQGFIFASAETSYAEVTKDSYIVIDAEGNAQTVELSESDALSMEKNPEIACVEKDFIIEKEVQEEYDMVKPLTENWSLNAINAVNATAERKVKVAVLDSGIDMTDNIVVAERKNFISDSPVELPLIEDLCGHGTSIASILIGTKTGSDVQGVNSNIELYSARVLDEYKQAPISRIVEAIYWAIEKDVDIINISFGTQTYSDALKTAIDAATDNGILVVAATGNHGSNSVDYPAAFDNVLSVGAINAAGEISSFSSTGENVDVVAPGEAVLAQGSFGEDLILSGTSLAAPHVAGVASLLWSKDMTKPATFIKTLIKLSAKKMMGSAYGLIDYNYALQIYDEVAQQFDTVAKEDLIEENDVVEVAPNAKEPLPPAEEESTTPSGEAEAADMIGNDTLNQSLESESTPIENENTSIKVTVEEDALLTGVTPEEDTNMSNNEEVPELKTEPSEVKIPNINSAEFEKIALEEIGAIGNDNAIIDLSDPVVDGSWYAAVHQGVIANAAMKSGAVYADNATFMKGMTGHPEFHGYSWHNNPSSTTFNTGTCNYIANYNYIVKLAQSYAKGNGYSSVALVPGQSSACQTAINKAMQDLLDYEAKLDSTERKFYGKSDVIQKNFVMGLAAHTALDACAHSTFETKSTTIGSTATWTRITHADGPNGMPKADDPDYKPQRSEMAGKILANAIIRSGAITKTSSVGNSSDDFYPGEAFFNKKLKFRMNKIKTFAQSAGMTTFKVNDFSALITTIVT